MSHPFVERDLGGFQRMILIRPVHDANKNATLLKCLTPGAFVISLICIHRLFIPHHQRIRRCRVIDIRQGHDYTARQTGFLIHGHVHLVTASLILTSYNR